MLHLVVGRQCSEKYLPQQLWQIVQASPRLVANQLIHPSLDKPKLDFSGRWQSAIESSNQHDAHMYSQSFQLVYHCDQSQLDRVQQHGDPRRQSAESFCDIDMTNLAHHACIKQFHQKCRPQYQCDALAN